MQTEEQFSEKQSISLIKEMVEVSSKNLKKDGLLILAWGVAFVLGAFLNFFPEVKLISKRLIFVFDVFGLMLGIGVVLFTVYYVFFKKKGIKTYVATTAAYTWFGIIVVYNLIVILIKQKTGEVNFELLHPMQMALIGLALFVTGGLYREKLLLLGGVVYWFAAYFAVRYRLPIQLIFEFVAGFIGFIIPGAWLYYQSIKNV
ncbi:MAG: hypothetical protein ACERKD_23100 [Prolixibacteraceae bacterium]